MELIFQVKWKQLKQVEVSKHLKVYYMKPLNSPTPLNTPWIETSVQTAARNLKSKHRVVVVPQLNINSTAIVKVPTSMNLLYVKCWSESNVVRKLTQHTVYRSKLQKMFFSDNAGASVLVLQLHFSFGGRKLLLETKLLLLTKKLIEKFEKKMSAERSLKNYCSVFGKNRGKFNWRRKWRWQRLGQPKKQLNEIEISDFYTTLLLWNNKSKIQEFRKGNYIEIFAESW